MVVSGDVTFKGKSFGYSQALNFFENTWLKNNGARNRFISCPGNHDKCNGGFDEFDKFLYGIRRDHKFDFSKNSNSILEFDGVVFLALNSSFHLKHEYGLIDLDALKECINKSGIIRKPNIKIAVLHHHLIGAQEDDISTIRNSLPLISLLDDLSFDLILHGHRHSQMSIYVGKNKMQVISTRSLNFDSSRLVNGMNLISYENGDWFSKSMMLSEDNSMVDGLTFR
jgi:3',5'-cyclic AMP phosphodiesterase CpdA